MPFLSSRDKANTGLITIIFGWTFTALAALALALMAWAHRLRQTSLGADDSILVAAFIAAVILVLQITWAIVDEGLDRHISEVSRTQLALIARSLLANQTLWGLVNTLVRVSALLFTKRIFGCEAWIHSAIWGLVIISVLYGVAIVLEIFLICRPLAATWDSDISGDCGDQTTSYVVLEIVGLFIGLAILILPLTALSKVQIPWRSKVRGGCVLSSGTVVMIITGLRIQALHITNSSDFTYSKGYIGLLSVLGGLLGGMTCCVPSLLTVAQCSPIQTLKRHWVLLTTYLKTRFPDASALRRFAVAFRRSAWQYCFRGRNSYSGTQRTERNDQFQRLTDDDKPVKAESDCTV